MLRIAKIVVIYKNNIEENNNRFSVAVNIHIAYICCHELPRSSPSCYFAQVWGEARVGNAIPPIFPRQCCVFSVDSPRNSLFAMFIYFYHTHN